jgi:hypothetical protein
MRATFFISIISTCLLISILGCSREPSAQSATTPSAQPGAEVMASPAPPASPPRALPEILPQQDEATIRLATTVYILRDELKLTSGTTVFTSLSDRERETLAARFPRYSFKPSTGALDSSVGTLAERHSQEDGVELNFEPVVVSNDTAVVGAEYRCGQTTAVFECVLKDTAGKWTVQNLTYCITDPAPAEMQAPLRARYEERNHRMRKQ